VNRLAIEPTKYSPKVYFDSDKHLLEIQGKCYPEDVSVFAMPIFAWLESYFQNLDEQPFIVNVDLTYFNSSSSKMLLDIFERLDEEVENKHKNITVNWLYSDEDDCTKEYGEDFQESVEFLAFNLIPK